MATIPDLAVELGDLGLPAALAESLKTAIRESERLYRLAGTEEMALQKSWSDKAGTYGLDVQVLQINTAAGARWDIPQRTELRVETPSGLMILFERASTGTWCATSWKRPPPPPDFPRI